MGRPAPVQHEFPPAVAGTGTGVDLGHGVDVVLARLGRPLPDDVLERVLSGLDPARRGRLARFRRREDVERGVVADVLARVVVAARAGTAPSGVRIRRGASGAPHAVVGTGSHQHVSLSHSGLWVACAVSGWPTGVDVEALRRLAPAAAAALVHASPAAFPQAPLDARRAIRTWTAVEAYLKMLGTGLAIGPEQVRLDMVSDRLAVVSGPAACPPGTVHLLDADPRHLLAVCGPAPLDPADVHLTTITTSRLVAGYLWDDVPAPLGRTGEPV